MKRSVRRVRLTARAARPLSPTDGSV